MLSAEKILKLVWMMRPDLRRSDAAEGWQSAAFRMWWRVESGASFPAWRHHARLGAADILASSGGPAHLRPFGMSRVLQHIIDQRADLRAAFDVTTEDGLWAALAWFFTYGATEYGLLERFDDAVADALDAPAPALLLDDDAAAQQPCLSWLMLFVWRGSPELRQTFDLRTVAGQVLYTQWFLFDGVPGLRMQTLVGARWRAWLRQPVRAIGEEATVARGAMLLWHRRPDLQAAFDAHSAAGWRALSAWAASAWAVEPCLSWIDAAAPGAQAGAVPAAPPAGRARPFGVNLIGFAYGELGIGEDVRMAVAACEAAGIPFSVMNIHPGAAPRQADRLLERHVDDGISGIEAPYAVNVFCLTAFDTARAYLERGMPLFEGRYNIGWWPWELPVWPNDWHMVFDVVDEVWAATTFTQAMYRDGIDAAGVALPVTLMPLPASVARAHALRRADLGIPDGVFVFLYVFDFNSYPARKNPAAALDAFHQAFDVDDQSVRLVFKTMNGAVDDPETAWFMAACGRDARVVVIDGTMDRADVLGLIAACDAYVSPHRAEGFGRTLAEAMLFGKPVVATDFSGSADFLHADTGFPVRWRRTAVGDGEYPFIAPADGAWWAQPDTSHMARQMRAAQDAAGDAAFGRRVTQYAREQFSERRIGQRMRRRLEQLAGIAAPERDDEAQ